MWGVLWRGGVSPMITQQSNKRQLTSEEHRTIKGASKFYHSYAGVPPFPRLNTPNYCYRDDGKQRMNSPHWTWRLVTFMIWHLAPGCPAKDATHTSGASLISVLCLVAFIPMISLHFSIQFWSYFNKSLITIVIHFKGFINKKKQQHSGPSSDYCKAMILQQL